MRKLRITGCSDGHMWYAGMVGHLVELLGEDRSEYLSREPAGYVNIVKKVDAEIVELQVVELIVDGVAVACGEAWLPAPPASLEECGFVFYGALDSGGKGEKVQRYKDTKPRW